MSVPSMVHRSGNSLIVRSVVSGDAIYGDASEEKEPEELPDSGDLPDCKIKRNYSCGNCDFFTQNPRHFLYHLRDVHNEKVKIYECPSCIYASKHFQKLLRHAKMVHGGTEGVELPEFPRSKGKKRSLPEEETEDNSEIGENAEEEPETSEKSTFKCSLCSFTARGQNQLTKHEREEHIKTKFFRCTKCTYVTHMKARFTKHVKYHSMPMIKCDMCDFRTPYKWNLDRHCKNHNGNGAFRCSACNFTADIKQSLTVHEMNHHVPPVGQAAGLGVGRRRNKVGASDSVGAEEAAAAVAQPQAQIVNGGEHDELNVTASDDSKKFTTERLKISAKKLKTAKNQEQQGSRAFGSDFIHPDDIIHHANGNIYIKNKCKLCNFKSAWDGEMARHEQKVHNILRNSFGNKTPPVAKKPTRPVPNLIPLPTPTSLKMPGRPESLIKVSEPPAFHPPPEEIISQKDMNDICAKSANSALRDFASLFNSEDVFKNSPAIQKPPEENLVGELLRNEPVSRVSSSSSIAFKQKNASFFDKLKEKLMTGAGENVNLTCQYCGHKSKCLSELAGHQKICGKQQVQAQNFTAIISSSRCQYCRQRCKSSTDLFVHLQTCPEAIKKIHQQELKENHMDISSNQEVAEIDENCEEIDDQADDNVRDENGYQNKPHPMENRVFVWNNIEVPLDVDIDNNQNHNDQQYVEYNNEERQEDNVSLDLSIRTQSPMSDNSYVGSEPVPNRMPSTEKIPTHGNDINTAQVAQHKRVFKCPHCSFWASTASRFHVHIVGHLNKKPFECSLCAYRSNWRWDITKHIKLKSVRDPAHERAKVLMTDETGRRNYTKYNKYLTEIQFTGDHNETSGGAGTRPRNNHDTHTNNNDANFNILSIKTELPKLTRAPSSSDFSPLLKSSPLRPPPPLKAADESFFAKISLDKKKNSDAKKTLFKCKKCNFRDASHEKLLNHVKGHYQQDIGFQGNSAVSGTSSDAQALNNDERHCRLKHRGDIRVLVGTKSGIEKLEVDDQTDEPDHIDVLQTGTFKCKQCPFSNNNNEEFESHLLCHVPKPDSIMKCYFCTYYVSQKEELCEHLKLHGVLEPEEYMLKMLEKNGTETEFNKKYKCALCPYVTNSKSQFLYHKQFHKPKGGQYSCTICSYNVSKRHLLHQHLKVHNITSASSKHQEEVIDLDEIPDESEEGTSINMNFESQNFADIPLVWVSKNGKFSKMFKCRYCPHVNLRKVNIQEHEKMHGFREKSSTKGNEVEHRCNECNYVCNNAGVLSSHSKVHQGLYGQIHCLVDTTQSEDKQIRELSQLINLQSSQNGDAVNLENEYESAENSIMEAQEEEKDDTQDSLLYFCHKCPARFLKENEYIIHMRFHSVRLFYKCDFCSYAARQKPHLLSHAKVHTSEYQERTKELRALYNTSLNHRPPQMVAMNQNNEIVWVAVENVLNRPQLDNFDSDIEAVSSPSPPKHKPMNVPISGTELYQQKSEAEKQNAAAEKLLASSSDRFPQESQSDSQLVQGNPKFIYPTYQKNGRMKEKRYKCHKCPSAFEKREQYKVHLSLHGAKQRYKCDYCDYSVKYYANYVQHLKKHQSSVDAQGKKSGDSGEEVEMDVDEIEESALDMTVQHPRASKNISSKRGPLKLSTADRQALMIINQRRSSNSSSNRDVPIEDKKLFWCSGCPYTNHRKDAVDNHQKRHISISGFENNYTCDHCDYSAPQQHFIRDHSKLHFSENKMHQVEGYMACDSLKLTSKKMRNENGDTETEDNEHAVFETVEMKNGENQFLPCLEKEVLDNLNNNKGEKIFVNPESGEVVQKKKVGEENELEIEESIS